ncbi:MAG: hypothetical protein HC846_10920 [Blastocatellia bacterium]|nr:hypothetical protein [Blastocatellia bacterium]
MSKEEEIEVSESEHDFSNARRILKQSATATPEGAIGGTVIDQAGAVIPNAEATVKTLRELLSGQSGAMTRVIF